ncbi:MAG: sensor histidine kinase [Lewinellaceae bacterium]|nr:sensor histidine kinase [Lewinellaceae bacterium]
MKLPKDITISQVTIIVTIYVIVISILGAWIIASSHAFYIYGLVVLLMVIFLYVGTKFLLDKYVFRRIKIIYKLIYDSKKDKSIKDINTERLDEVNQKVIDWAVSTKREIASLQTLEEYRRNFVGDISHELKTPIFSIQAYIHTLLEGGLHDEEINMEYLKRALDNTTRLQSIVEDLDIISKLEANQTEMDFRRFDIKELVTEIFQDIKSMAKKKNISLALKEGASQSHFVLADWDAIRQVLTNLLVNSIKYGKEGGSTKVSFYPLEGVLLTEVSDDGIGIDEKHLKHLFDRFYRVDKSRSRKQGGSGLGLSIVKHIIEAHDQTINIRSTPGIGSTFGFTLQTAGK